jgi:hypothetical protein
MNGPPRQIWLWKPKRRIELLSGRPDRCKSFNFIKDSNFKGPAFPKQR